MLTRPTLFQSQSRIPLPSNKSKSEKTLAGQQGEEAADNL